MYIGPKSRTERPRKTKIGTEVAHVTRDWDTTFKVKGQGHQAAMLTTVLARQAASAVGVGTCWPWETAATLPSAWRHKALRRPWGRRGAGRIVAVARLQLVQLQARFMANLVISQKLKAHKNFMFYSISRLLFLGWPKLFMSSLT